ncbi:hypothetical protein ICE98_03088 [Lactococcus lactis]|nr:hypothetical protein [Lactococcus lactis]
MAVEKELIALRKDYKISQKQISKAIGLSEEQYRRKELGQYDWRATEMFCDPQLPETIHWSKIIE